MVISCFVYVETGVDVKVTFEGPGSALLSVSTDISKQNTSTKVELHDIQGSEITDGQYNCTVELNNSIYSAYITFESELSENSYLLFDHIHLIIWSRSPRRQNLLQSLYKQCSFVWRNCRRHYCVCNNNYLLCSYGCVEKASQIQILLWTHCRVCTNRIVTCICI